MKWMINLLFVVLLLAITFFGLGPVLLADGTVQERLFTLVVVILLYLVVIMLYIRWRK